MPKTLTDAQIKQRLIEGRNYKRLYFELKDKFDTVVAENKALRAENAELKHYFTEIFEAQAARIEELEAMVFGRKPGGGTAARPKAEHKPNQPRTKDSYHRPPPKDEEITGEQHHAVSACSHCGGKLTDIETYVRYVVDIRKLVLKRVRSFGVKTKKGARTLEVLLSVCWSFCPRSRCHKLQQTLSSTSSVRAPFFVLTPKLLTRFSTSLRMSTT